MEKNLIRNLIATPGAKHKVASFDPAYTGKITQAESEKLLKANVKKLRKLQSKLYAEDRYAILLIFQAMDGAGKDGTIKHVMSGVNPQGCQVYSFKQPSAEELDHDFLWRIHKAIPERGRIGIFNRSHYEDVLISRVHPQILLGTKLPLIRTMKDITPKFWRNRYQQINDFERYLTENGVVVLKFFLNVSNEEQKLRFLARIEDETKNWKFSVSDIKERGHWEDYMKAYSDMLTHTSTDVAPWYVIPADNKWFMRYAVGEIIVSKMEALNLRYPRVDKNVKEEIAHYRDLLTGDSTTMPTGSSEEEEEA
ncbi:MAG: polyphosphate kinase 2 family protein [Bacteroides sp.]|nr:polyphosphate kinase 2 family protein [Bacteroides sp.]